MTLNYSIHGIVNVRLHLEHQDLIEHFDREYKRFRVAEIGEPHIEINISSEVPYHNFPGHFVTIKEGMFFNEEEDTLVVATCPSGRPKREDIIFAVEGKLFSDTPSTIKFYYRYPTHRSMKDLLLRLARRCYLHDTRDWDYIRHFSFINDFSLYLVLLSFLPKMGYAIVHCSCCERNGKGILIHAGSGQGKTSSTLELCSKGHDFVSDDTTLISARGEAYGLYEVVKLEGLDLIKRYGLTRALRKDLNPVERIFLDAGLLLKPQDRSNVFVDAHIRDILAGTRVVEHVSPIVVLDLQRVSTSSLRIVEVDIPQIVSDLTYEYIDNILYDLRLFRYFAAAAYCQRVSIGQFLADITERNKAVLSKGLADTRTYRLLVPFEMTSKRLGKAIKEVLVSNGVYELP